MSESSGLLILVVGSIPTRPTNKIEGPARNRWALSFHLWWLSPPRTQSAAWGDPKTFPVFKCEGCGTAKATMRRDGGDICLSAAERDASVVQAQIAYVCHRRDTTKIRICLLQRSPTHTAMFGELSYGERFSEMLQHKPIRALQQVGVERTLYRR